MEQLERKLKPRRIDSHELELGQDMHSPMKKDEFWLAKSPRGSSREKTPRHTFHSLKSQEW